MLKLRKATSEDARLILTFIKELAEYEKDPKAVVATEENIRRDGFGAQPKFEVVIAEWDGDAVGMAFYFFNYSTWKGRHGMYLEDLIVRPSQRGNGIGKAIMAHLASVAVENKCFGIRWEVLDWNKSAIRFYESLGAEFRGRWQSMQINGDALKLLAASEKSSSA